MSLRKRSPVRTNYSLICKIPRFFNQRDGAMQQMIHEGTVNYEPNSLAGGMPCEAPTGVEAQYHLEGNVARQKIGLPDDFTQAGERYRSLGRKDRDHLVDNIVDSLGKADKQIQKRTVGNFNKADAEFGKRVAKGLKL